MIFGIVGYGRFGKLWAEALTHFGQVLVYDTLDITPPRNNNNIKITSLAEATQVDILFVTTPISVLPSICSEIKIFLRPNVLIVDCCSVKIYPARVMQKIFCKQQALIATHPLFGPDSVKKNGGLQGHRIFVCPIQCDEIKLNLLTNIFTTMGLKVLTNTLENHDQQMAICQSLVHFIGRGLAALEMRQHELATPDFQALLNINNMVLNDSRQLFLDMQHYNPYTKDIREKLIRQLVQINNEVNNAN